MLVMTTIFTTKIQELPPTSDMKMIDIWLIFCLVVPFLEVILRTAIECNNCSCDICEPKGANVARKRNIEKGGKGQVWFKEVLLATLQVCGLGLSRWPLSRFLCDIFQNQRHTSYQALTESQDKKRSGLTETNSKVNLQDFEAKGIKKIRVRAPTCRKGSLKRGLKYTGDCSLRCILSIEENQDIFGQK